MRALHVVLLPGWRGAGRGHWLSWLAGQLRGLGVVVHAPALPGAELGEWLAVLRASLAAAPPSADLVVLAHGLGANLWLHHAAGVDGRDRRAHRVLLVAPPGPGWRHPEVRGLHPAPVDSRALRRAASITRLVAGLGDPYCSRVEALGLARGLGVELDLVTGGEHLNEDAGFGAWPEVLAWTLGQVPSLGGNSPAGARS
ncbi:alpha/beta hydrolase [Crossiella sp. CA-258035]|uniref:RBBP9/YdeN family alpha/beta hydrolase n=1 Tax=Crossiella sp. CA-258035 TaxID=2981138 RepID=UPI0024BD4539|nr:alpha/beta hydrolase [Crossiella sp. CA-258035]WHT20791.1 alpha/beta hydrolase [Crossiella sp. CA-258035]